jgi:hypothetical protein
VDGRLRHVGVQAADRAVEHHRAERLDLRVHAVHVVRAAGGRGVVVLKDEPAHARRYRVLGQRGVVDVPLEQRGGGVRVHVDRAAEQSKIWTVHRRPLTERLIVV